MILSVSDVKNIVDSVLATSEYTSKVNRIGVFGSTARGTARGNSDVDLIVDMKNEASAFDYIYLGDEFLNIFEDKYNKEMSLVEWEALSYQENDFLSNEIKKDVVWIYGRE